MLLNVTVSWAAIGVISGAMLAIIGGVIAIWVKMAENTADIRNQKEELNAMRCDARDHERLNEATFAKIENNIKDDVRLVYAKLDDIYKLLIHNKP